MYDPAKDPNKYLNIYETAWHTKQDNRSHQSTKSYTVSGEMIGNKELPIYGKALDIYVPNGIIATISLVPLANDDSQVTTYTRPPGVYLMAKFVRRIVAINGDGVVINVEHD